jgi:hypothetical protein
MAFREARACSQMVYAKKQVFTQAFRQSRGPGKPGVPSARGVRALGWKPGVGLAGLKEPGSPVYLLRLRTKLERRSADAWSILRQKATK